MTDARTPPHSIPLGLPLLAASAPESLSFTDELSDDDLEQVVGGLARTRDSAPHMSPVPHASYTISVTATHAIVDRVSA